MPPKKILIVAGEPSGDLHAANLVRNIKRLSGEVYFFGLGCGRLKDEGVEICHDMSDLALVGALEVLKNIVKIKTVYSDLIKRIDSARPDLAILVDYPGFNLRLAKDLKRRSIPVVYYISPQVWIWGADRIDIIKGCAEKIIVFFKFEEELYRGRGVKADFVGHPLLDTARPSLTRDEARRKYGLDPKKTAIAILPGSRKMELERLLPISMRAASILARELVGVQFLVAKYRGLGMEFYGEAAKAGLDVRVIDDEIYDLLRASDFAIVASGTATLEAAIIGTPMVIIYKVNLLTYIIAKLVSGFKYLGLVNIIHGDGVVPELLQYDATPEKIAAVALQTLKDETKKRTMLEGLRTVREALGAPGASERAAKSVLEVLNR